MNRWAIQVEPAELDAIARNPNQAQTNNAHQQIWTKVGAKLLTSQVEIARDGIIATENLRMDDKENQMANQSKEVQDGAECKVIGGVHKGKSGIVRDVNTSKTGAVTITVVQADGERFKTLAKNVVIQK